MKNLLCLILFCSTNYSLATPSEYLGLQNLKNVEFDVSKEVMDKLLQTVFGGHTLINHKCICKINDYVLKTTVENRGSLVTVIDDFADKIFENIDKLIIDNGLDPVVLPNATLNLIPTGQITLTDGSLQDLSTIARYEDVTSTYKSSEKLLIMDFPITFDALLISYKYHTQVLLLSLTGDVIGKLDSVKIHVTLQFDFNNYTATMTQCDMKDTGNLSVQFEGLGLVDWMTNTMTSVVSLFLHPIIIDIIDKVVKVPLNIIVDAINKVIVCILTPAECTIQ